MVANVARSLVLLLSSLIYTTWAAVDSQLTGTWTSKSRQVVTGSGFYDPAADELKEPPLTGISYSFSDDGYYEEAYYRAISEPSQPECAKGILQWQHGSYSLQPNGSLVLKPIAADGRQLLSDPCAGRTSMYSRYNQTETFKARAFSYRVYTDKFHGVLRLDLEQLDGLPIQPLYILYNPPEMLPTSSLNATDSKKSKRDIILDDTTGRNTLLRHIEPVIRDGSSWWWFGVIMTSVGGLTLVFS
ncbi:chaperone for protein-folding within the ER, fungal-domain-containing protein [Talaromyces proteolyticus]|uniref:Protein ROT1 n=1 Tax=Talaromyces proteolyticus TaxID=1131652 RepID=A0AAD4KKS3_9EURO|nr:chaperone for protein-folding within the ER, fungal-domain-containing protein [Talaromyces proteolyticus]KAH8691486.1 chaperone for protein-folding within the ER, fungal-domain-containing protein [Talaromyces proteolyticus]